MFLSIVNVFTYFVNFILTSIKLKTFIYISFCFIILRLIFNVFTFFVNIVF
jgi:hypothetical protein